uniref:Exosome complex component (RRP4, EXOSC2) n=1 Tax=uncultured marine group II/III euryarchaeote KM3_85_C06 TaxID=1456526 RepID=A0A075HRK0_9EURY|nr:exosome complex component (RRP4, EXOSC2) [uncultured marine group II/III euryarchaeote KM3_85_C06]
MSSSGASDGRTSAASGSLVIPGDKISSDTSDQLGHGVIKLNGELIATKLGYLVEKSGEISIIPVHTAYFPRPGDLVIGYIEGMRSNIWFIDLNAPFNAILPMSLAPMKIEYGGTRDAMDVGTTILCRVQEVDEAHSSVVTMKGMGLRKVNSGFVDTIPPHLVGTISSGSNAIINQLKDASNCRIILGANGRIWVDGEPEGIRIVRDALAFVRDNEHSTELADAIAGQLANGNGE